MAWSKFTFCISATVLGRPVVRLAHGGLPGVIEADVRRDVDRDAGFFRDLKVFAESGPACGLAADEHRLRLELPDARAGGRSFTENLGGHALADFALGQAVFEEQRIGMRVHVDEAGGHDEAGGVDLWRIGPRRQLTDEFDLAALNSNVGIEPGVAGAVDDLAVGDDQIEGRCARMVVAGSSVRAKRMRLGRAGRMRWFRSKRGRVKSAMNVTRQAIESQKS